MKPRSPIEAMIDAATGYQPEERPRSLTPQQKEAARQLARDVVSDLRFYYPAVLKAGPSTAAIHLRNTIAGKVERLLADQR